MENIGENVVSDSIRDSISDSISDSDNNIDLPCSTTPNTKYNLCVYSSFIYLTNALVAYYYEYYIYSALFVLLTMISFIYHSTYNKYIYVIDKIVVLIVVSYGGYILYNKNFGPDANANECPDNNTLSNVINDTNVAVKPNEYKNKYVTYFFSMLVVIAFLTCLFLYYYGYISNKYCFTDDIDIACMFHSLMHLISSFGHHIIVMV
jgi:hypothetical protein